MGFFVLTLQSVGNRFMSANPKHQLPDLCGKVQRLSERMVSSQSDGIGIFLKDPFDSMA
jgi:hypothetical protein